MGYTIPKTIQQLATDDGCVVNNYVLGLIMVIVAVKTTASKATDVIAIDDVVADGAIRQVMPSCRDFGC